MAHHGPGKSHRKGISVMDMAAMFAAEQDAVEWFENLHWSDGEMVCLRCGSDQAYRVKSGTPMPYRCKDCKRYFSLKTGTVMEDSKLPLRLWAWAIYLEMTSLKGVSSMKLHRDLGVRQATALFMLHRIREAFAGVSMLFEGPVEVDETYIGGLEKNKPQGKQLKVRGGVAGKTAVVRAKDRKTNRMAAKVVERTDGATLKGFVTEHTTAGAKVYTDEHRGYKGPPNHETVRHSVKEHVNEFAGRQNVREMDTLTQMQAVVMGMVGTAADVPGPGRRIAADIAGREVGQYSGGATSY